MAESTKLETIMREQMERYSADRSAAIKDAKKLVERFQQSGIAAAVNRPRETTALASALGMLVSAAMQDAHRAGAVGAPMPLPPEVTAAILLDTVVTAMGIGYSDGQARNGLRAFEEAMEAGDNDAK